MNSLDNLSVNSLRVMGAEIISKAKSGHPGIVLGAAPIVHTLFTRHLNINPQDSKWFDRDRFILSAGHGSMLLYEILHLAGFISLEDIKSFRQKGSLCPGHPEYGHTAGVEVTTGPLGQGIAMSVGLAISEKFLAARFNKNDYSVINHYTYVLCGDGDLQEGVSMEAMSLAGHLGLDKLIVLYDSNDIQLDGEVALANSENTKLKMEAMGWRHIFVENGNDCDEVDKAINLAKESDGRPVIIEIKTTIGYGAPNSGEASVHGKPLSTEQLIELRKNLDYHFDEFDFPEDVKKQYKQMVSDRGYNACCSWNKDLEDYSAKYPADYKALCSFMYEDYKIDEFDTMPKYEIGSKISTRKVMGQIIDWMGSKLPNIMGGSADLSSSTMVKGADGIFGPSNPLGRNIKFGVREHAMAAITNGITVHGGLRAYCAGFFVFSDYMKPAIRLAALMSIPSLFYFSHDSICVGEDGPTHQPIEQLTMIRSIPNTNLFRPADAREMTAAIFESFKPNKYPTVIVTTRQDLPVLDCTKPEEVSRGAYVAYEPSKPCKYVIVTCGSELSLCLEVAKKLESEKIYVRVVSMPSMFLFDKQSVEYKESILPSNLPVMAVEMGSSMPWYKYAKVVHGIDTFGLSMPLKELPEVFGFTVDAIIDDFKKNLKK